MVSGFVLAARADGICHPGRGASRHSWLLTRPGFGGVERKAQCSGVVESHPCFLPQHAKTACREGPLIEKSLDFSDVLGDAVGRQTLEEDLPITLLLDSRIEQNQQSPVFERADEAPKALL